MPRQVKILIFILPLFLFSGFFVTSIQAEESSNFTCAVYFTGVGCPHCANTDPVVLEDLPKEYPNLIVIEYEIYQQSENAPLLFGYNEKYNCGLGIPLIIFNRENYIAGDKPILNNINSIIERGANRCPLVDGSSVDFNDLDLVLVSGFPKIWHQEKILIKTELGKESQLIKDLLTKDNLNEILKGVEFEKIEPLKIPLSGRNVEFEKAIKINDWVFQWNGQDLEIPVLPPEEESPPTGEQLPEEPIGSSLELTLPKILFLAVVDAINPCALAVLTLMLIAILTYNPTQKRDVLLAGLAFIIAVFVMYLIYGLIIIKSFQLIQALTFVKLWLYKILGGGAVILGCFKLRDFFRYKAVCKVSPKVDRIISKITSPKGALLVGAFVTIFLLPCTIGPYVICGGILCPLGVLNSLPWLLLYNLIFILPMLVVVLLIYLSLGNVKDISNWQAKNIRYLHLIAGLVILGLGIAMLLGLV
jgi:cytochrome c biogenesis protein CcdA